MDGYEEADKIDHQINVLALKYDITKQNGREWLKFTRTNISTLQIIQARAHQIMED